jgi:hypothetical protein
LLHQAKFATQLQISVFFWGEILSLMTKKKGHANCIKEFIWGKKGLKS